MNMIWQGPQRLPTSAPRELRKETERFTGSPEPQAESGWSYDDENDASEESIPLQRNWENYVAWAVNLTAVRRGSDVGMAKQKYLILGRLQPISIIGCNDYIPSCWLSHSRKKLRTGARLRLQVTFIIQRRRLQTHRLPDIETLRGLPGLFWIFCAGNYYNVETSAIQKTSRFFELGYWKHLDVPL